MTSHEYELYKSAVARFLEAEGIECLSPRETDPYFSHIICECCQRRLAGNRYDAEGHNPHTKETQVFAICEDCVYYSAYGQLDDTTMLQIQDSKPKPGKEVQVVAGNVTGADEHLIGEYGIIRKIVKNGFEVELSGHGSEPFIFTEEQLEIVV